MTEANRDMQMGLNRMYLQGLVAKGKFQSYHLTKTNRQTSNARKIETTSSTSESDCLSEYVVKESTLDDLPQGYLYTYRGIRRVQSSMKFTGYCGPEEGLHKLVCGHWVSTSTLQPCGINCHLRSFSNEDFRCRECCEAVQSILANRITGAGKEKLQLAKDGYHVFYIARAVEYVSKHSTIQAGVTEAVMHALTDSGHACALSDGPKAYDVDIQKTAREIRQRAMREPLAADNTLAGHEKRARSDEELDDVASPTTQRTKRKPRAHRASTPSDFIRASKRSAHHTDADEEEDSHGKHKRTTPTKALHGGATRSPHFSKTVDRLVPKRSYQNEDDEQG
ncbi:hypothetical protein E8E12_000566 [Didymella heteroderae]|uniref:Uncharacterized protein n=1 Tax=Didymella heteroderae TaxID=1769908 RepID=A0A9P4WGK8_9PLEO|nr:hypothetical protein E8E12_000566 [Didymella heteroderae]